MRKNRLKIKRTRKILIFIIAMIIIMGGVLITKRNTTDKILELAETNKEILEGMTGGGYLTVHVGNGINNVHYTLACEHEKEQTCHVCKGQGGEWVSERQTCPDCAGNGMVVSNRNCSRCLGTGAVAGSGGCTYCGGTGITGTAVCSICHGSGFNGTMNCDSCGGSGVDSRSQCPGTFQWSTGTTGSTCGICERDTLTREYYVCYDCGAQSVDWSCSTCTNSHNGDRIHNSPKCSKCGGSGSQNRPCSNCEGDGEIFIFCPVCNGSGISMMTCPDCQGTGKEKEECSECQGSGYIYLEVFEKCPNCNGSKKELVPRRNYR